MGSAEGISELVSHLKLDPSMGLRTRIRLSMWMESYIFLQGQVVIATCQLNYELPGFGRLEHSPQQFGVFHGDGQTPHADNS